MTKTATSTAKHSRQDSTVASVRAESEAIFKSIGDGAITTDEYGHITRINPAALEILGIKLENAIDQWFPKVIPAVRADGEPVPLIERPIFKMFLNGKPVTEKILYRSKRGKVIPVNSTVSPIIFNDKPVGAIEVFRDITLENEVDRMKSEFISIASHQLRTPLSTIKTYAHMLSEGYMGDVSRDQAQAMKIITNATNNMNELIATLLNIARIESGSIFKAPKQAALLKTDSLIVKEVLANLISNAIKYTPRRGKVTVTVHNQRQWVEFMVEDTGVGIPEQSQDKIFSKFFRAHNVVQKETTGTGLGLYVVRGLVMILHGKIWFKSAEYSGSTFYVALPKNTTKKSVSG